MDISFFNDDCKYILSNRRIIRKWLREVAIEEGNYSIGEINYVFCSARRLLEINKQFLGHDYFTDIITFDYSQLKEGYICGEIYIDIETVKDNARIYGSKFTDEMRRVVVHGVLHLCGQKDKTPRANKQMHAKEDKYLELLSKMM